MARKGTTKPKEPLPPPLPPETRPIGQLVAEALRLYGRRFWASLALGVPIGAFGALEAVVHGWTFAIISLTAGSVLLTLTYVGACVIVAALYLWRFNGWMLAGVAVSVMGALVQASGFALHAHFNHNDLYHVIQIGAMFLFYRGLEKG